jgi:hypothetical protein
MNAVHLLSPSVFWSVFAAGVLGVLLLVVGIAAAIRHHYRRQVRELRAEMADHAASTRLAEATADHLLASVHDLPKREPALRLIRGGDEAC